MRPTPTEVDERIGKALRRARANVRMSRNEAARRSGIAAGTIRNMEYGIRSVKASYLIVLAELYQTSPDVLTGFLPIHQGTATDARLAAFADEVSQLRRERDELAARLRGVIQGSTRCGEPHWRRERVICERTPGHRGDHRSESAGLGWTSEKFSVH